MGALFQSRGLGTVRDLLFFFPRAYEDRTQLARISDLQEGQVATVALKVVGTNRIPLRGLGRTILEARCMDESGTLSLKWFRFNPGIEKSLTPGASLTATGKVKIYRGKAEIAHPEITWKNENASAQIGRIVPIYVELEGISSRVFRKALWSALEKYESLLKEDLPSSLLAKHRLPGLRDAVRALHFPPEGISIEAMKEFRTPYHERLIYEEFVKFEFMILRRRLHLKRENAPSFAEPSSQAAAADLESALPFKLTGDQRKTTAEILSDLSVPHPMNRLVQGDVGSGKTAVAFLAAGAVIAQGMQSALMAPTEILAEQHYRNAVKLFGTKLSVYLLTGSTSTSEREKIAGRLESGQPLLLIGTHAILEEPVVFKSLALVIIDEQHRFGVDQRRTLRMKGRRLARSGEEILPHTLVMTATPIPRTLALTVYGDLSISALREMPPGRTPVKTLLFRSNEETRAHSLIREQITAGRQAYFVFPLVNDSEAEGFTDIKSAASEAERLQTEVFPDFKVGLLHGQMSSDEKQEVMQRFKSGEIQILVSTTVIEVGVDVPNATIMAVAHSERFGLSQLHQLRGRVGRGQHASLCILFTSSRCSNESLARLEILSQTTDGFRIAEADLEYRGPGEFLGVRQAGGLPFKMANLVRDQRLLLIARDDAITLLREDPSLERSENWSLRQFFDREGSIQFERLKTS